MATVRIASLPIDGMALALYAHTMGFFSKVGLDVDLQEMQNGASILAAVAGGSIDIGASELTSLTFAHDRGLPITLVYGGGIYSAESPTEDLVVRSTAKITTAADLNGKMIAVISLRGFTQYAPMLWVDENGGQSSTLRFAEIRPSEIPVALQEGRIDASLLAEPFITACRPFTRNLAYACNAIAPRFLIAAYFVAPDWASTHPNEIRAFRQAMRDAALWANRNQSRTAQILAKEAKMDASVLSAAARVSHPTELLPAMLQPLIDLTAKYGGTRRFDAAKIIYHP